MPQKYRITTDQGVYEVTVEEPSADAAKPAEPNTNASLKLVAAGKAAPVVADVAYNLGSHPTASAAGRLVGQTAGATGGFLKGMTSAGAKVGGYLGEKTAEAAQRVLQPVAVAMEKAAPYAQTLSTLGGAQGVLDIAQMAEPDRKDIGFLGLGKSMPDLEVLTKAVEKGANPAAAAAAIAHGDTKRFGALMTAYMQSRQVKK